MLSRYFSFYYRNEYVLCHSTQRKIPVNGKFKNQIYRKRFSLCQSICHGVGTNPEIGNTPEPNIWV